MSDLATLRDTDEFQVAYCYWLSQLTHLNERSALKFKKRFPTLKSWLSLAQSERVDGAKSLLGSDSPKVIPTNFDALMERAVVDLKTHRKSGIEVLPIDSNRYPQVLKQISDPPLVLFVKGSIDPFADNRN